MKTSRPVDARLWTAGEDPGLQSELRGEYTRPKGDCHEHAARFDRTYTIGEGPGLKKFKPEAMMAALMMNLTENNLLLSSDQTRCMYTVVAFLPLPVAFSFGFLCVEMSWKVPG